jgi:hypothetical protein
MAKGMSYATEFKLPAVAMTRLFDDLDRDLDQQQRATSARAARAKSRAAAAVIDATPGSDLPPLTNDDLLQDVTSVVDETQTRLAQAQASVGGTLRHFTGDEILLTAEQAGQVIHWFWPEIEAASLGTITDEDRSFAQALLLEGVDASLSMGIVEGLFRETYMKVPKDFSDLGKILKSLAKRAIKEGWFKKAEDRIKGEERDGVVTYDLDKVAVYESIRVTIARNFRSVIDLRAKYGEPLVY